MHLYSTLCVTHVPMATTYKYYIIRSFKNTLNILVILFIGMRLQMIQNSNNLEYNFNVIVLIFQRHSDHKGLRIQ
jgi:hypothetical protein